MNEIGDKIKYLRKEKGLSQEELGFELGISRQAISKWENGTILPNTENLKSLCKFFSVSMDEFVNNTANRSEVAVTKTEQIEEKISVTETDIKKKKITKFFIVSILVVFSILFVISAVIIGFIIFQPKYGADSVTSFQFNNWHFIICIIISIILVTFLIVYLCIFSNKNKK